MTELSQESIRSTARLPPITVKRYSPNPGATIFGVDLRDLCCCALPS
jgi:hypothetical protein